MLKKITVLALAVMALAALSASTASAKWKDGGVNLPPGTNPQIQFTGQAAFTSAVVGGIECQTDAKAQFLGDQTTGTIDQFEVDLTEAGSTTTQKCTTSGPLAPCFVTSAQATNLPWTLHSDGADTISITTGQIHNVLESAQHGACGVAQSVTLEPASATHVVHATITSGETTGVKEVHLSGSLTASTGTKVVVHGTQKITGADSGTYGTQ